MSKKELAERLKDQPEDRVAEIKRLFERLEELRKKIYYPTQYRKSHERLEGLLYSVFVAASKLSTTAFAEYARIIMERKK